MRVQTTFFLSKFVGYKIKEEQPPKMRTSRKLYGTVPANLELMFPSSLTLLLGDSRCGEARFPRVKCSYAQAQP